MDAQRQKLGNDERIMALKEEEFCKLLDFQ